MKIIRTSFLYLCITIVVCFSASPFDAVASDEQKKIEQLESLLQFYIQENAALKTQLQDLKAKVAETEKAVEAKKPPQDSQQNASTKDSDVKLPDKPKSSAVSAANYVTKFPKIDDETICKYASILIGTTGQYEKQWSSSPVARRYVKDAMNRGLTCGVGEAVVSPNDRDSKAAAGQQNVDGGPVIAKKKIDEQPNASSSTGTGLLSQNIVIDEVNTSGTKLWGRVITAGDFNNDGVRELLGMPLAQAYLDYIRKKKPSSDKSYWGKGAKLSKEPEWQASFFGYNLSDGKTNSGGWKVNFNGADRCVHPSQLLTAHLNNDKFVDFVIVCHGYDKWPFPGEHSLVAISNGPNNYDVSRFTEKASFYHDGAIADFDGDGRQDILLVDAKKLRVFLNDDDGQFRSSGKYFPQFATWKGAFSTEILDVNDDGYFDVFVAGHEDDKHGRQPTVFLLGNKKNKFSNDNKITIPSVKGYGVVLDVIKEGKNLFLVRTGSGNRFYKDAVVQHVNLKKMQTVDVLVARDTKHGGRIFRKSDDKGRLRFGGLTDRSGGIDVVFDGKKLLNAD